jgi:ectoine hydroxylase-related dioxygenase (phytanoyl-CoA dioxygenase family)
MRFFDKYTGFFRRLKLVYVLNNLWNYKHLKPYQELYKKYGLRRPVWRSLSSKHLKHLPRLMNTYVSENEQWEQQGFVHLEQMFSSEFVDELVAAFDRALEDGRIDFNYTQKKVHDAHQQVPELKKVIHHQPLQQLLKQLVGEEVIPFQTINFVKGSEQAAHSDSIHMATYPEGGLVGVWVALEDVDEGNGTVFYYPGSHKLPYTANNDCGNSTGWLLSPNPNKNYEDYLAQVLESSDLQKVSFNAKKGDVLIWHANLIHGGLPHLDKSRTRKSMVVHYFAKNRICYHELSQRPAIVREI